MNHRPSIRIGQVTDQPAATQCHFLAGKLLGTPECYEFLDVVRDQIHDGKPHVRLLMHRVDMVNSSGIGILAAISEDARRDGGGLTLVGLPDRSRKVLAAMHLEEFLQFEDAEQA